MADIWTLLEPVANAAARWLAPRQNERQLARFEKVYAPLSALFLTRHITIVDGGYAYPYLRQRLENARRFFRRSRFLRGIGALFDRQRMPPTAEVEYGGSFPLSEILRIVKANEALCDDTLLNLIACADRARYEEQLAEGEVTAAELALFNHIVRQHRRLSRKFVGK